MTELFLISMISYRALGTYVSQNLNSGIIRVSNLYLREQNGRNLMLTTYLGSKIRDLPQPLRICAGREDVT
jgi:hypothetical protein